jgi:2,4-dienoyl-CoA reductase-like NADH-dependent reductase (Old Yellow Enzyme family)
MEDSIVFSPFQIKKFTFRNRLGVAPMTRLSSSVDGIPRQDVFDFLVRRAQNGSSVVFTEAIVTDYESSQGYPNQSRMTTQRQIDAWGTVVDNIHDHGGVAVMQMFHCGRMAWPEVNPAGRSIAPSRLAPKQENPLTGQPYPLPDVMSQFDIDHVINGFVETAKGAVAAGFDGVEVHGAHGYLICQFLSSYSNQRDDNYGGSMENRFRLAHEVLQSVALVVPDDRLLTFRISNWGIADMQVSLFESASEWQEMISLLVQEPIDAISLSTYNFRDKAFGTDLNMAQLTREVTPLPLMICGQIYDLASAEEALASADIALSSKSTLLNPDWVSDVRARKTLPLYKATDANIAYGSEPLP